MASKGKPIYSGMTASEKRVASYLKELNLWWKTESPIFIYDDNDRPRVWTPDFYLTEYGIYVEMSAESETLYAEDFD